MNRQYLEMLNDGISKFYNVGELRGILDETLSRPAKKSDRFRKVQFFLICVGAGSFIAWKFLIVFAEKIELIGAEALLQGP